MQYKRFVIALISCALLLSSTLFLPQISKLPIVSGFFAFGQPDPDARLAYFGDKHRVSVEHDMFYYGMDDFVKNSRKADIVIIGHSRTLFGFDRHLLDSFARKHGVTIYHLGFPSEVTGEFPLLVMEKFNIRPKLVLSSLMHGGHPMLIRQKGLTRYARNSIKKTAFDARLLHALTLVRFIGHSMYHSIVSPDTVSLPRIYRSVENGCYYNDNNELASFWDGKPSQVVLPPVAKCEIKETDKALAISFIDRVKAQGATPLFFNMPQSTCEPESEQLIKSVDGEYLPLDPRPYSFYDVDGFHLDSEGAREFTSYFLERLEQSPAFIKVARR